MSAYIDFADLKARVKIEDVAKWLELELKASNNQFRCPCPGCNEGGDRALAITPAKQSFYCFAEKTGGDLIKLVAHVRGIGQREAAEEIAAAFLTPKQEKCVERAPEPRQSGFDPDAYAAGLEHDHPAVEAVGLGAEVAKALSIGFASKGILAGTVAVPVRLSDGTVAGFIGLTEIARLPKRWNLTPKIVPFQKKAG